MLDSLVRVSRRVGWGADRFAIDPECRLGSTPSPTPAPSNSTASSPTARSERQPGARALGQARRTVLGRPEGQRLRGLYHHPEGWPPSRRPYHLRATGHGALPPESAHVGEGG